MKNITRISLLLSATIISGLNAATTFSHFSGDDISATGGVTGSSISQILTGDTGTIHSSYTGAESSTRAGTDGFYNPDFGAVPSGANNTRFGIDVNSTGGNVNVRSVGADDFFVTIDEAGVTEFSLTFSYLGQFIAGNTYDTGFTGRWSFLFDGTNNRGVSARNTTTEDLIMELSAVDYGGGATVLGSSDFLSGVFEANEYGDAHATISGYNTNAISGTFENNEGVFFHNGSDLGDTLDSVTFKVTAADGTFDVGTEVLFTMDAMVHEVIPIPEPSSLLLTCAGLGVFFTRRKR